MNNRELCPIHNVALIREQFRVKDGKTDLVAWYCPICREMASQKPEGISIPNENDGVPK